MRTGGKKRKEKREGNEETGNTRDRKLNRVSTCLFSPVGHLLQFSKFTQDAIDSQGPSSQPPFFLQS